MEKIIYNTKLKKIIIAILIAMLALNLIAPIVYAAVTSFDPKQFFNGGLPENADEIYEYEDYLISEDEKKKMINNIKAPLNDPDIAANPWKAKEINDSADAYGLAIDEFNKKLKEGQEKGLSLAEAISTASEHAADKGDERLENMGNEVLDEKGGEDIADLGGILLSPVFYLINFIADAIISNLGNIMLGESGTIGTVTGTTVLQASPVSSIEGKSSYYTIDPDLDNVIGVIQYPNIRYTPEEIFAGKIDLLSIDFISGKNYEGNANQNSGWINVRKLVSEWYKVLRMVAIIGLLSVLIYTGIKIIISANAKDKAKYKEWIINWVMAVAILFAMHLIMAFIISVTGEFSKLLNDASEGIKIGGVGNGTATNLMGYVRFMVQSEDFYKKVAYEVMYIALIVYTIKFTLVYLKRVLNMAFLTLIAPIVALTYPIDKINDGRAQGFDMWIKEYIFNALLQPMHQLLYYILVGSAISIAATNPIYGIVVLAFMTEAEKLLKKIFGFDKAGEGTVGGMAGAFAAGAIASNIKNIAKMAKLPSGNSSKSGSSDSSNSMNALMDAAKKKDGSIEAEFLDPTLDVGGSSGGGAVVAGGKGTIEQEAPAQTTPAQVVTAQTIGGQGSGRKGAGGQETGGNGFGGQKNDSLGFDSSKAPQPKGVPTIIEDGNNSNKKSGRVIKGFKSIGKAGIKPLYDMGRNKEYNKDRWKRRLVNGAKGLGKVAVGATLGTAAAAVQAGISITDGKYNPMEGFATFAAGYAGGSKLASSVGGNLANSFNEGYYSGPEGEADLIEKKQKEFGYSDDVHKKYVDDWGEDADTMKNLAKTYLVSHGITDIKKQKSMLKFANKIAGEGGLKGASAEMQRAAMERARKTSGFIDQLESQGQKGAINDPDKQQKYIDSIINSQNLDATNAEDAKKIKQIQDSYTAAFKSAAQYYQVNRA